MGKNKNNRFGASVSGKKKTHTTEKPESFMKKNPVWAFHLMDKDHPQWSMTDEDIVKLGLLKKLGDLEGQTWQDISSASGGKKDGHGSESHYISVSEIAHEAQKRLEKLHQEDLSDIYSLRVGSTIRLWGILSDGVFYLIWYDRNHEIYKG